MSLFRSTSIVSALTLLSRILGFIRDLVTAQLFGSSFLADAFFVALRIPNLLRSFVAEGALTAAFVPVISEESAKGAFEARSAVRSMVGFALIFTSLLVVAGFIFSDLLIELFAPGFRTLPEQFELSVKLLQIMLPYVICISLVALANGALNALNIYGAAAWAQVLQNIVLIAGAVVALFLPLDSGIVVLAASVLAGGIVQVAAQVPALSRNGLTLLPSSQIFSSPVKRVLHLIGPALVGATVYQLTVFLNTVLASLLATGSVAWLYYADRLVQLPLGLFTIALASVLLPHLSRAAAKGDNMVFAAHLGDALRYTSFIIIPIAALLYLFAEPVIALIFERGAFDRASTAATASAVQAYSIGLWAVSSHSMLARAFIARKDTITPTLIGTLSLLVSFLFSLILMGPPQRFDPDSLVAQAVVTSRAWLVTDLSFALGHTGLALSASIAAYAAMLASALIVALRFSISLANWLLMTVKTAGCAAIASIAIMLSRDVLGGDCVSGLFIQAPLWLLIYLLLARTFNLAEANEFMKLLQRGITRKSSRSPKKS